MLPPHNNDVTKPGALNTFLNGLAELGVEKRFNQEKKVAKRFNIIEKEKGWRNAEN